jgi:hypothetical protein
MAIHQQRSEQSTAGSPAKAWILNGAQNDRMI